MIKAWARAVAGTTRRDGRGTLYEDIVGGLQLLDVEKEGEG